MPDKRLNQLTNWLQNYFGDSHFYLSKASDDASFRRYFRVKRQSQNLIIMDAPPDQENSQTFVEIAQLLRNNKVHSPSIFNADLSLGFLLIEDLGDTTFLQKLTADTRLNLYKLAIDELLKMQRIKVDNQALKKYDEVLLNAELELLIEWYLPQNIAQNSRNKLHVLFNQLIHNSLNSQQVFVHRDYHARNLMIIDETIAVIDFQDAVIGSNTYDLVSLLKDAYVELKPSEIQILLNYFYTKSQLKMDFLVFEKQFDLMGLQRHLKILGIFKRLSIRDGKNQYLNDIPLVKKYVLQMADKYPEFAFLRAIL
jgi:aminoglycoside/choline kinase family phosphotransferase